MGIGASIFLIAVGAIMTFAIEIDIEGLDLQVVGVILMIAGVIGLLVTLVVFGRNSSGGGGRGTEDRVYRDRPPADY